MVKINSLFFQKINVYFYYYIMYWFDETLTIFDIIYFEFIYRLCKTQVLESIKY